jgi:hypothetical protein
LSRPVFLEELKGYLLSPEKVGVYLESANAALGAVRRLSLADHLWWNHRLNQAGPPIEAGAWNGRQSHKLWLDKLRLRGGRGTTLGQYDINVAKGEADAQADTSEQE